MEAQAAAQATRVAHIGAAQLSGFDLIQFSLNQGPRSEAGLHPGLWL